MGAVVTLPTAAPRRVRQDVRRGPQTLRALIAGQEAGKVHRLPLNHWRPPAYRAALQAEAERNALYQAGGVTRSAPLILAAAMFAALPEDRQQAVLAQLRLLAAALDGEGPKAALDYAERLAAASKREA